jgi:hypothetical protein
LGNFFWRACPDFSGSFCWCVGQLIGFGFFISKKQKQCAASVVGTKSMIHFTEKVTEVLAGEQNKRLCNPDNLSRPFGSYRGKILFCVALGLDF